MKLGVLSEQEKNSCTLFMREVTAHYKKQGRHLLPWRMTTDPYHVLVSEIMLQQTQVDRVVPKYLSFVKQYPTVAKLARASFKDVAILWQGLGYNRRARFLHESCKFFLENNNGDIPTTQDVLEAAPGIGPYTAGAIMAFAYNAHVTFIETNIRTAFIHFFFPKEESVPDNVLIPLIAFCASKTRTPRVWYWALMDYGAYVKKNIGNTSRRSKHYVVQSRFKGSVREIRGLLLKTLLKEECPISQDILFANAHCHDPRRESALESLISESIITRDNQGNVSVA